MTKELAKRPTRPTAAPPTAVILQPRMSVKTLTMGEQKKIIPMESEPTHAEETEKHKLRRQGRDNRKSPRTGQDEQRAAVWGSLTPPPG